MQDRRSIDELKKVGGEMCHSRASGNPEQHGSECLRWVPAFAGMTIGALVA